MAVYPRDSKGRFVKGIVPDNKGKKIPMKESTRIKMLGRIPWNKGLKGIFQGKDNPFYGKKHTKESNEKNRIAHLGKPTTIKQLETLKKYQGFNKGKPAPWSKLLPQNFKPGKDHPMWKGGTRAWRGTEWKYISKKLRDKYPYCMLCKKVKNLSVHHIIPYTETHDNALDNLIVLCKSCHAKEDRYMALKIRNMIEIKTWFKKEYPEEEAIFELGKPINMNYNKQQGV